MYNTGLLMNSHEKLPTCTGYTVEQVQPLLESKGALHGLHIGFAK